MNPVNKGYNLYNQGARVYSDTQTQTQPTSTKPTAAQPAQPQKVEAAKTLAAPTQADKVSISDSGRAAVAQNKDSFVNAIMKAGYSREAAEARFGKLQSQRNDATAAPSTTTAKAATTVNVAGAANSAATPATAATSLTQPVNNANKTSNLNANSTSEQPENKALDRFVSGFTKSGYSKEQAISAYNTYAALANQQGVRA